jgi:hypothetical protein
MARNKMEDLRNHLFEAMERINDDELTSEQVENEVRKSRVLSSLSTSIIDSAKLEIDFLKATEQDTSQTQLFKGLGGNDNNLIESK